MIILAITLCLALAACGGGGSPEPAPDPDPAPAAEPEPAPAPEEEPAVSEDEAVEAEDTGGAGLITHSVHGVNLSVSYPEEGWSHFITDNKEYVKIYNKPPQDEYASNAASIQIRITSNTDFWEPDDAAPAAGRTIGGIAMDAVSYSEAFSTDVLRFNGVFNDSNMIYVSVINMDVNDPVVSGILDSIKFS